MKLQKIFAPGYAEAIRKKVAFSGIVSDYGDTEFKYDDTKVNFVFDLEQPDGLLQKLLTAESNCDAAIALYEAFPDISPILASYAPFWEYLAHVDLYPYVRKRWPAMNDDGSIEQQYILDHWFVTKGLMRHALATLWWTVSMSVDPDDPDDKYKMTKFLFDKREDFRLALGASTLFRHRPYTQGVMKFILDNPDVVKEYELPRERFIMQHFNRLGAVKQLAAMPDDFFYNELVKIKDDILKIKSIDDLP